MIIELVEYKYVFNKGNYSSETIGLTARVEKDESAIAVLEVLKRTVHGEYESQKIDPRYDSAVPKEPISPKAATPKVEAPEIKNEIEAEVQKPAKKPQKEREVKKKVTLAEKKQTAYDIENVAHKNMVGDILTKEVDPTWKKTPERAKAVSRSMAGTPFLDEEGLVMQSFKEILKEKYGSWKG